MRRVLIALLALVAPALLAPPSRAGEDETKRPAVQARVDPRVELLSIVFRLAGNGEYSMGKVDGYTKAVEERFGALRGHAVVRHAAALQRTRFVGFDAVMGFAVHLDDEFRPAQPLAKAQRLDSRWPAAELDAFVKELGEFAAESKAKAFFESQRPLYEKATKRMQAVLDERVRLSWFDAFFGARPTARFELALGLLNGPCNYGPSVLREGGTEELHCVLGVWNTDAAGDPTFPDDVVPTVVHEFCHSYCNAFADAHADELRAAAETLWADVAEGMRNQAYSDWRTMMRESLVRACVVRYVASTDGAEAARREIDEQIGRSFPWTGELSEALAAYEADRKAFPTLDAFMPRVVAFFTQYAARAAKESADAPKVVGMAPANGATDVDPSLTSIVVTFDRPMKDGNWAVVGGGPLYPKMTGRPRYDDARRVLTIPVELAPDASYEFWLNRGKFDSFRSEEGVKLRSVHVTFSTRAKR